jgi:Osmosensitive K+ channel histidine kinase
VSDLPRQHSVPSDLRRTRPHLALGILVAVLCVVAETLLTDLLQQITPVRFLGIMYLLGVVLVASVWGLWLGMATALVSTFALDYFFIPPIGSLTRREGPRTGRCSRSSSPSR